jgi:uncharacterized protein YukE
MSVAEIESGRRLDVQVPPTSNWAELEQPAAKYREVVGKRNAAARRLSGLQGELQRATDADRIALAKAIKEGAKDPGPSRVEKIKKEIAACERFLASSEEAVDMALQDVIDAVDEHRDEWQGEAEEALQEARRAYAETVEEMVAAKEHVSAKYALLAWVAGFPEQELTFRVRGSYGGGLKAENGDPYFFSQVIDALRADAAKTEGAPQGDPNARASQEHHEERLRNERAGLGYFTDLELERMQQNPVEFWGGAGARLAPGSRPLSFNKQTAEEE